VKQRPAAAPALATSLGGEYEWRLGRAPRCARWWRKSGGRRGSLHSRAQRRRAAAAGISPGKRRGAPQRIVSYNDQRCRRRASRDGCGRYSVGARSKAARLMRVCRDRGAFPHAAVSREGQREPVPQLLLASRGRQMGHDIIEQNMDLARSGSRTWTSTASMCRCSPSARRDRRRSPANVAIPMARDANDRLHATMKAHPKRFAGFAALPTADPPAAVEELERCVTQARLQGRDDPRAPAGASSWTRRSTGRSGARGEARRADLSASGAAASRRGEGVFRWL